jgi:isopentenyldiphosphate isomerase
MYRNSFALGEEHGIRSIAFPAIGDAFPPGPAASIAVREARAAEVDRVIFALVSDDAAAAYERALRDDAPEWITVIRGGIKTKAEVHRDGDWHVAAHIWIVAPDGRVLVQRRSTQKENWPGYWDVSAAGHVSAGETTIEAAIRETHEELGLRLAPEELERIGAAREQSVLRDGTYIDNEEHEIFVVQREVDLGELKLQEGEVDEVMLASLDRLPEPLVPHEVEYQLLRGSG